MAILTPGGNLDAFAAFSGSTILAGLSTCVLGIEWYLIDAASLHSAWVLPEAMQLCSDVVGSDDTESSASTGTTASQAPMTIEICQPLLVLAAMLNP